MTEETMTLPSKQEKQVQSLPGKQILNGFRNFELILQSQRDHCCSDKTEKEHTHTQGKKAPKAYTKRKTHWLCYTRTQTHNRKHHAEF